MAPEHAPPTLRPATSRAPLAAPRSAYARLTPIGLRDLTITAGPWYTWQRDNLRTTMPHAFKWLEHDGTIDNLRRLHPSSDGQPARRGQWFSDSDLYKALEAAAWAAAYDDTNELEQLLAVHGRIILDAQRPDGYINSYVQAGLDEQYRNLVNSHELYCIGHLIQAGVAHHRSNPDSLLFRAAVKAADRIVADFGDRRRPDTDGHEVVEMALAELHRETGRAEYLQLAAQLIDVRGHRVLGTHPQYDATYFQDAVPVRTQTEVVGHAVRAMYLLAGSVDVYLETGDITLLNAAIGQWTEMTQEKTYLNGALGSRFDGEAFGAPYELPPDLVYGETCATIGHIQASWRLLLATGEARFADAIERGLFNLVAASTGLDRTSFFYSNPAQRRTRLPAAPRDARPTRADAPGTRPVWFETACCPPNIMRTIAGLGGYIATTTSDSVDLHQFIPADMHVQLPGGPAALRMDTRYPDDGRVTVRVDEAPGTQWRIRIRRPAWAERVNVQVNGEQALADLDDLGYLNLERAWISGDMVEVTFDTTPRFTQTHPAVDATRGTLAIERGPLVYAFEDHDQPAHVDLNHVCIDPAIPPRPVTVLINDAPVLALQVAGYHRTDPTWRGRPWARYPARDEPSALEPVTLTAIPYALWANRGPSVMRIFLPLAETRHP